MSTFAPEFAQFWLAGLAAVAVGLTQRQTMRQILLPQATRIMLPSIVSQAVVALKDTSLGYIVLYPEFLRAARTVAQYAGSFLVTYLLIALFYILMNSILSLLAYWLERRISRRGRGAARAVEHVEEALTVG